MILLGYDLETTSNVPASTQVVQVAALARTMDGTEHLWLNQLCNPGVQISDGAYAIHGISNEAVANQPADHVVMKQLHQRIHDTHAAMVKLGQNLVLCGHHVRAFDIPIMERMVGQSMAHIPVIDTLVCSSRIYPMAPGHKLGELTQWLKLGDAAGAHDAEADIRMVLALVDHFCKGLGKSWVELAENCAEARILKVCHFGKHKGKPWGRDPGCVPYWYVKFMIENFDDPTPDMQATIWHHYKLKFQKLQMRHRS